MKNIIILWSFPNGFGEALSKRFPGEMIKTITAENHFTLIFIKKTKIYPLMKIFLGNPNEIRYIDIDKNDFKYKKAHKLCTKNNLSAKKIDSLMYDLETDIFRWC